MTTFNFKVKGSQGNPYELSFYFDGKNLAAICNCGAGVQGKSCSHRTNILKGDTSSIISNNKNEVANLLQVFKNTPLDIKLQQLDNEEKQFEKLKKQIPITKKEIDKIMLGK